MPVPDRFGNKELKISQSKLLRQLIIIAAIAGALPACVSDTDGTSDGSGVIGFAFVDDIDEPFVEFEPDQGAAVPRRRQSSLQSADLPYPPFNSHDIKAIGPDGWPNRDQIVDAGAGGVIFNMLWSQWQPRPDLSLNDPNTFEYDGMVWQTEPVREKQIRWYSQRGIKVTAVLYGTPDWARRENTAKAGDVHIISPKFIAPDNPSRFAQFTGMIAKRFNGANGNGRIVNFIVQNEVNSLDWYNPGCGADAFPCTVDDRIESYANLFNLSYDRIIAEQSNARVLFSFDHHFGLQYKQAPRFSSARHFIEQLAEKVGDRQWRIAFHSYPPDLFQPVFGPFDYPKITFGNIGRLAGYLRRTFPDKPHAWEIHLTENGINANTPSSPERMRDKLRDATRNILGTPGIETFVYHRIRDHRQEGSFQPGLHNQNNVAKPAWNVWSRNNRYSDKRVSLDDGYELLPYVGLSRSYNPAIGHWASTRMPPEGYTSEATFLLLREPAADTTLLFECYDSGANATFITADIDCGSMQNFGPVGYIYNFNNTSNSRMPLYSVNLNGADYLLSSNVQEGRGIRTLLGFVDREKVLSQVTPVRDLSLFNASTPANTPPVMINRTESALNNWGNCDSAEPGCRQQFFSVGTSQSFTLSCIIRGARSATDSVTLSYGSNTQSTTRNLGIAGRNSAQTFAVPLPVDEGSSWGAVILNSAVNQLQDDCVILKTDGLALAAANDSEQFGLLQNGGFEQPITDWEFCSDDPSVLFSFDAHRGTRSLEVSDNNCVYQEVAVEAGKSYRLACYVRNGALQPPVLSMTYAGSSFQSLAAHSRSVDHGEYSLVTYDTEAPPNSRYGVVKFQAQESGYLDSCSLSEI
ncbi:hypothetical protein AB833_12445 [Chromatiales bacterium (ex Bugula neritina AB1)]|nr:hypothetical protein AB833_12445 [Chromatiales bacterium (ex Bugula neritina AB1)]